MWRTFYLDMPAWKCSISPFIECTDFHGRLRSRKEIKEAARFINIKLRVDSVKWYLDRKT
jgi:hypothetical protein